MEAGAPSRTPGSGAVHRRHREHQQRDEVEPVHGDDRHGQAEREQRAGGPDADEEAFAQMVRDRRVCRSASAVRTSVEFTMKKTAAEKAMPGGPRPRGPRRSSARAAHGVERDPRGDPRDGELGGVEHHLVERTRGGPGRPRATATLDGHGLGQPVDEQEREGEGRGEVLAADPWSWIGKSSPARTRAASTQNSASAGPMSPIPTTAKRDEHRDAAALTSRR